MKRLIIVYNPRSARFAEVERDVLEKARKFKGWMICKFQVREASVEENAEELAEIIRKDDLVISAGGDGTASMVLNAIMESGKLATMGVMGYGNFNDYMLTFGEMKLKEIVKKFEEGRYNVIYPLRVKVNGKFFRYVGMYLTVGMLAESVEVFEKKRVRKRLGKVRNRLNYSANVLARWYFFFNKWRKDFLPEGKVEVRREGRVKKETFLKNTTDYIALNGESMAGVLPAEGWTENPSVFFSGEMRNRSFFRMLIAFVKGLEGELPGRETEKDRLVFREAGKVAIHIEGEEKKFEKVKEIEVEKTGASLRVIRV